MKLSGLIAAPFTPFCENGEINYEMIPRLAKALIDDHVKGAYICGTTGEGISCSVEERIRVMEAWKKAAGNKLVLIAHTGALSLNDVKILSKKGAELQFNAFSVIPTTFFKPSSEEVLADYCREVASFAPELPFYYYHTMNSGVNLSMSRFLEIANIPNLAGVKFNHHNMYEFQKCLYVKNGKYDIVFGVDEFFAGALALGAKAFIGSTYNYSAKLYQQIWTDFDCGNWKDIATCMNKVVRGVDLLVANGGIPAGKAMMAVKGLDCGPARLPLKHLTLEKRTEIASALQKILDE